MKKWMKTSQGALLLSFLMVLSVMLTGFMWNEKTVTVHADGQTQTIKTHLNSAKGILQQAGIPMEPDDRFILDTDTLHDGSVLTVRRAFPVQVLVDGEQRTVKTAQFTVGELVEELGYELPNYVPVGNSEDLLYPHQEIKIAHVTNHEVQTVTRTVAVETIREADDTMYRGEVEVIQEGKAGTVKVEEEIFYENGIEVKRHDLSTEVIEPMTVRIVREGSRDLVETSRGDMRFKEKRIMQASAYLPGDGDGRGITATGIRAVRGVVAVDPDVIPLGTRMYVEGYGMAVAADTGGDIVGNRIDLLMEGYGEAMEFGRRDVAVYILP